MRCSSLLGYMQTGAARISMTLLGCTGGHANVDSYLNPISLQLGMLSTTKRAVQNLKAHLHAADAEGESPCFQYPIPRGKHVLLEQLMVVFSRMLYQGYIAHTR